MKSPRTILICILFVCLLLLPAATIIFACLGYMFKLTNMPTFVGFLTGLSLALLVLDIVSKDTIQNKALSILLSIMAPLSLVNAAFCIVARNHFLVLFGVWIVAGCCCYLTLRHTRPFSLKLTTIIVSGVIAMPILLFSFFSFLACITGNFVKNTVVQTLDSPTGKYYVQVIDSDQGALGGNTIVYVYETKGLTTILFTIQKKPQKIYLGEWGEYKDMEIYWDTDHYLVINSVSHKIK